MLKDPLLGRHEGRLAAAALTCNARELALVLVTWANDGEEHATLWAERLTKHGIEPWLEQIDSYVRDVELVHTYSLNRETKQFEISYRPWREISPTVDFLQYPDAPTAFAWIVMKINNAGLDGVVKRCEAKDCENFHVRKGRWCSDACGSRMRVSKKRERDRKRQML